MTICIYCTILTTLMCTNCAVADRSKLKRVTATKANGKRPFKRCEHITNGLEVEKGLFGIQSKEFDSQHLCDKQNKRARTNSCHAPLPDFARTFRPNIISHKKLQFDTCAATYNSQTAVNGLSNIGQTPSSQVSKREYSAANVCMSQQKTWSRAPNSTRQIASNDAKDTAIYTQNLRQSNSQSKSIPDTLDSYRDMYPQLNIEIQAESVSECIFVHSYLTSSRKWLEFSDQSVFYNTFDNSEEEFYNKMNKYALNSNQSLYNNITTVDYRIIHNDLNEFILVQKVNAVEKSNEHFNQFKSQAYVYLPNFEHYYERCKKSLSSKTTVKVIYSQEWSGLAERQANFMMYTDFSNKIALSHAESKGKLIIQTIESLLPDYNLNIFLKPNNSYDTFDNQFNPNDYFLCSVITHEEANSYIPIDTEKYTLVNAVDYVADFAMFKHFVFDTFFSKHPSQIFRTIKEELWKLQLFVSEIYLYLTWRLTITENISVYEGDIKYGLKEEINDLASLVDAFYRHSHPTTSSYKTFNTLKVCINKFRSGILAMLKHHYYNSAMYQFYRIAHEPLKYSEDTYIFLRNRDIIRLIAFTPKTKSCESLSNVIIDYDKSNRVQDKFFSLASLSYNKLGRRISYKVEVIKILIAIVKFIRELKPSYTPKDEEKTLIIVFRDCVVAIAPGANIQSLKVSLLSNCGFYIYFHRLLYDLFAY